MWMTSPGKQMQEWEDTILYHLKNWAHEIQQILSEGSLLRIRFCCFFNNFSYTLVSSTPSSSLMVESNSQWDCSGIRLLLSRCKAGFCDRITVQTKGLMLRKGNTLDLLFLFQCRNCCGVTYFSIMGQFWEKQPRWAILELLENYARVLFPFCSSFWSCKQLYLLCYQNQMPLFILQCTCHMVRICMCNMSHVCGLMAGFIMSSCPTSCDMEANSSLWCLLSYAHYFMDACLPQVVVHHLCPWTWQSTTSG